MPSQDTGLIAVNVRRLMARDGLTFDNLVEATGLDERTIRALIRGASSPHARTIHKLAEGLGVSTDELFCEPLGIGHRTCDRATNPLVDKIVAEQPTIFQGWSAADFDELYSRFGAGGQLTESGVLATARAMNVKKGVMNQVRIILESSESDLLTGVVELLYQRATYNHP